MSRLLQPSTITNILQHGESMFNVTGQIGGDAVLSPRGEQYALKLPELVKQSFGVSIPSFALSRKLNHSAGRRSSSSYHLDLDLKAYHRHCPSSAI